jgi:pilus assembly protein CpaD
VINPVIPVRRPGARGRWAGTLSGAAALLALAALSAGCSTTGTSDVDPAAFDYRERHPIMISEEPEVFEIRVGMNGPALSPAIEAALRDYVVEYRVHGTGSMTIQVPTASANEIAAASTGRAVHYALVRAGVPHGRIQVAPYHVGDHSQVASVRVSYLRVKAVAPRCGVWPEKVPSRFDNAQLHNFGCATQQNLAAMVANPADLVRPQPTTPASGTRRANVINDYGEGLDPQSEVQLIESEFEGD